MNHDAIIARLRERFGPEGFTTSVFRDNHRVIVPAERLYELMRFLKEECGFDLLVELTAADYLRYPEARDRYGILYVVRNTATGVQLVVKTLANDPDPAVPSVFSLWKGSDWMEREVYDMYGVVFTGHPDLRRILLPEEFTAFPLRKDYPLRGRGERHNFPVITRAES
jgi:NADH-quinone oxidoreductase subunit C